MATTKKSRRKPAGKRMYSVVLVTTLSKFIGEFEASSEAEALEMAAAAERFQQTGGVCYHCTSGVGDQTDQVLVAEVV